MDTVSETLLKVINGNHDIEEFSNNLIRELRNDIGVSSYETEIKSKKEKVSIFQVIKEKPHLALPILKKISCHNQASRTRFRDFINEANKLYSDKTQRNKWIREKLEEDNDLELESMFPYNCTCCLFGNCNQHL